MPIVEFKNLPEGAIFTHHSIQYQKTAPVKVSCCTTLNAVATGEPKNKIMVRPLEKVTVDEQQ